MKNDLGPDPFALLCDFAARIPPPWNELRENRVFEAWRCLFNMSQDELAGRSGTVQTQISRIEGGFDARLSTWRRVYDAMGFDIFLLPVPRVPLKELEKRARDAHPGPGGSKLRARPRRRWKEYYARRRAEKAAARGRRPSSDRMSA